MDADPGPGGHYRLSMKKRYTFERKYRKKEMPIGEQMKEKILAALGKKPAAPPIPEKKRGMPAEEKKEPQPLFQVKGKALFRMAGLIGLVLILGAAALLFAQTISLPEQRWTTDIQEASLSARVVDSDIITMSDAENFRHPYRTAYSVVQMESAGLSNITINAAAYGSPVPNAVFVLRSNRFQAETYSIFLSSLTSSLSEYGVGVNEISMDELNKLGSGSFLIIPSGYMPEELLSGDNPMLYRLMDRGVIILYVGQDFSRMLSESGAVVPAPQLPTRLRITFAATPVSSEAPFKLRNGLYSASGLDTAYSFGGSYSAAAYKSGYIIFAPQTLDGGWASAADAASDASTIFVRTSWLTPRAQASATVPLTGSDTAEIFTPRFDGDSAYVKVYGRDAAYGIGFYDAFEAVKSTRGEIFMRGYSIMPGSIAPSSTDLFISLRESAGGEKFIFISITNISGEVDRFSAGGSRAGLNSDLTLQHSFVLAPGDYILSAVDQEGNEYARSYLRVRRPQMVPTSINTVSDVYIFTLIGDGTPMAAPSINVKVGGGQYGSYDARDSSSVTISPKQSGYGPLPEGRNTFNFTIGNFHPAYYIDKVSPTPFFLQPQILGAVAIALLVLGFGIFFRAGEAPIMRLDIPDFPPQSTEKVSLSKDTMLGLFDKVNQKYKWKNTPLKLAEIKGAFRDINHEGKPLFISDYNLEYLLDQMVGIGLLRKEAGYYSKSAWEQDSGQSAKSLSMFRSLRDICINEATPFTQPGSSKEYDSKITILGQDMFVHFYDGPQVVGKVLGALHNGLNIILAEDDGEVEELNEFLSSGLDAATRLKLEIDSGSVQVRTLGSLQQMIKDMKL
jgi:hypothetical protein